MPSLITLMTDFGMQDTYVAQMKGVILGINPQTTIIDITHSIAAQNVQQAALYLDEAFDAFPPETIHLVVVDPGVGSARKKIAVEIGSRRFVGPDNGLLTRVAKRYPVQRVHELTEARFHRQPVSDTFHGRDVFAPVAAHWSLGVDIGQFGPPLASDLARISVPEMVRGNCELTGEIVAIDRFGNLISNIAKADLPANPRTIVTEIGGRELRGLHRFYAEQATGTLMTLVSSSGYLEIAQNGGAANQTLQVTVGTPVRVKWDG